MKEGKIALLTVSEGLNNHPSHIIEAVRLLVSQEYEAVFVLPYPDYFKEITVPEHIRQEAINKVFNKAEIAAIIHVEKNPFIDSLYGNASSKLVMQQRGIKIEDYSEMVEPLLERMQQSSSQGRDALLIYKKRTEEPMEEPEFQAAMQICINKGAIGVAVIMYKEIPYQDKQEWIDQINVIEPGFICANEETNFLYEVLEASNINGIDIAIIKAVERNQNQDYLSEIDIQKMN